MKRFDLTPQGQSTARLRIALMKALQESFDNTGDFARADFIADWIAEDESGLSEMEVIPEAIDMEWFFGRGQI